MSARCHVLSIARRLFAFSCSSAQLGSTGASVGTEVLALSLQGADASTAILGTPQVLALERLRSADHVPIAVIHPWLPVPTFADLTAEDLHDASVRAFFGGYRERRSPPASNRLGSARRPEIAAAAAAGGIVARAPARGHEL